MFKQHAQRSEPNHKCPNCGREFFNTPDNAQCYGCGEHEADRGEEAGLWDPFASHDNSEPHMTTAEYMDAAYNEAGEW